MFQPSPQTFHCVVPLKGSEKPHSQETCPAFSERTLTVFDHGACLWKSSLVLWDVSILRSKVGEHGCGQPPFLAQHLGA